MKILNVIFVCVLLVLFALLVVLWTRTLKRAKASAAAGRTTYLVEESFDGSIPPAVAAEEKSIALPDPKPHWISNAGQITSKEPINIFENCTIHKTESFLKGGQSPADLMFQRCVAQIEGALFEGLARSLLNGDTPEAYIHAAKLAVEFQSIDPANDEFTARVLKEAAERFEKKIRTATSLTVLATEPIDPSDTVTTAPR